MAPLGSCAGIGREGSMLVSFRLWATSAPRRIARDLAELLLTCARARGVPERGAHWSLAGSGGDDFAGACGHVRRVLHLRIALIGDVDGQSLARGRTLLNLCILTNVVTSVSTAVPLAARTSSTLASFCDALCESSPLILSLPSRWPSSLFRPWRSPCCWPAIGGASANCANTKRGFAWSWTMRRSYSDSTTGPSLDYVNYTCMEFTGQPFEKLKDEGWLDLVHPEDRDYAASVYRPLEARTPFTFEYRVRAADGAYRWLLAKGLPRFGPMAFLPATSAATSLTKHKDAELISRKPATLERSNREIQQLAGRLLTAHEDERRHLARNFTTTLLNAWRGSRSMSVVSSKAIPPTARLSVRCAANSCA